MNGPGSKQQSKPPNPENTPGATPGSTGGTGYYMGMPNTSNSPAATKHGGDYRLKFFERIRQLSGVKHIFKQQDPKIVSAALKELESDIWEENLTLDPKNQQHNPIPIQAETKTKPEEPNPANGHKPVSTIANSGSPPPQLPQVNQTEALATHQVKVVTEGGTGLVRDPNQSKGEGAGSVGSIKQNLVDKEVVQVDPKSDAHNIEGGRAHSGHEAPAAQQVQRFPIPATVINSSPAGGFTSIVYSGIEEYKKIIVSATQFLLKEEGYLQVMEKFKAYAPSLDIGRELRKLMRCYLRKQLTPLFAQMQQSNVSSASLVMSNLDERNFVKKVLIDMQDHLKELYPNSGTPDEKQTAGRLVTMRMELEKNVYEKEIQVFGLSSDEGEQDPFGTIMPEPMRANPLQPPVRPPTDPSML